MRLASPRAEAEAPPRFSFPTDDAEMFCEPLEEARRLLRWLGPITTPRDGRGALPWRALRCFMVAPFTQLTFASFDLQMFLFDVFHTSRASRVGHFVGMVGVNLFAMALAIRVTGSTWGGAVYAGLLLAWYAVVARSQRLWLWWALTASLVAALFAVDSWLATCGLSALAWGLALSGAVISFSHAFEPYLPPRAGDPFRWTTTREFVFGTGLSPVTTGRAAGRALRVASFVLIGWVNEVWAAPRLLPYNVLRVMLAAGYAPTLRASLDDRARRAWASGNPAIDYVGVGGGTFLASPAAH